MKTALAVFGGFVLSLALFLSGAVVAVLFLTGKPARQPQLDVNQSEVWTKQPRAVDRTAQQFERLPPAPPRPTSTLRESLRRPQWPMRPKRNALRSLWTGWPPLQFNRRQRRRSRRRRQCLLLMPNGVRDAIAAIVRSTTPTDRSVADGGPATHPIWMRRGGRRRILRLYRAVSMRKMPMTPRRRWNTRPVMARQSD